MALLPALATRLTGFILGRGTGPLLLVLFLVATAAGLMLLRRRSSEPEPELPVAPPALPGERLAPVVDNGGVTRTVTDAGGVERVIYSPPPAAGPKVQEAPHPAATAHPEREIYSPPRMAGPTGAARLDASPPAAPEPAPAAPAPQAPPPPVINPWGESGGMVPMAPPPPET
jgi:hypothetical protein